ncbi:MAG: nucleotidyltransferase family protein [Clostridia bacterium]|nr:nucleotidyltransferase family protein [Clostridia bacterium]
MATGIICEFNPFHNGHAHLISTVKKLYGESVFCAMSGNFVQRGEYAAYDKFIRAEWAVNCGADVVTEIPFPFSCATAEKFAAAGVSVISSSGVCDSIAFGAEEGENLCGKDFFDTAQILLEGKNADGIKNLLKKNENLGFARARELYIRENYGDKCALLLSRPNSILGVEYAKAILSQNAKLDISVIPRIGQHDGMPTGNFCSASFLREDPTHENFEKYCPECVSEYTKENLPRTVDEEKYFACLCAKLLFTEKKLLSDIAELPCDYVFKLKTEAAECKDLGELLKNASSRHITNAKLRRMLIYLITNTEKYDLETLPRWSFLLAYSLHGTELLRKMKKSDCPLITLSRLSDIDKLPADGYVIYKKQLAAERLFGLLAKRKEQ